MQLIIIIQVSGICMDSLPAGDYIIEMNMGACALDNSSISAAQPSRLITGDKQPSRLSIEEVRLGRNLDTSEIFNHFYLILPIIFHEAKYIA